MYAISVSCKSAINPTVRNCARSWICAIFSFSAISPQHLVLYSIPMESGHLPCALTSDCLVGKICDGFVGEDSNRFNWRNPRCVDCELIRS